MPIRIHFFLGMVLFVAAVSAAGKISWRVPEDGGTPRDTNRIAHVGPHEFTVRAAFEEGGASPLQPAR